jgi:UDP-N-acetylglucosamine 2-epimerase (hydrolysing)
MENQKKKILFITGTRADYGKLKPLMKAVEENDSCELYIFVGGMHLLSLFGSTYTEVIKDEYKNIHIAHGLEHSDKMSKNLGNTITHLTKYVDDIHPDMIVVHGDRIDALAGAIVGALNNITVAHIEGGEVSGTIDESIRHAISKFAHLHLVANEDAKRRIIQLGEESESIFVMGSPDIDIMVGDTLPVLDDVKKRYEIGFDDYGILIYHPVTTEYGSAGKKIKTVTDAVLKSNKNYIVIYPNNDLGFEIILDEYSRFKNNKNFTVYPSMRFEYFLTLLKNADFIVGNSSVGIREASIYGIPTIDIGDRQSGRYNSDVLKNIQHAKEDVGDILAAIDRVDKYRIKQMHFGQGDSTEKFIEIISNDDIWNKSLQKKFIDLGIND